jgi:hypothetical protein
MYIGGSGIGRFCIGGIGVGRPGLGSGIHRRLGSGLGRLSFRRGHSFRHRYDRLGLNHGCGLCRNGLCHRGLGNGFHRLLFLGAVDVGFIGVHTDASLCFFFYVRLYL